MKQPTNPTPAPVYLGHVKAGVVILDGPVSLPDGQAVRVEPLGAVPGVSLDAERAERVRCMGELFARWTDEDATLSDADTDLLRAALTEHRGDEWPA